MKLSLIKFSQRDPRWANEKLGTSSLTIGEAGCAVSALATVLKYYNFDTDPSRLNKLCIEKGVYLDRNLMKWWDINKLDEFVKLTDWIDCPTTSAPIKKVDDELNAGRPIICWVDGNPNQPGNQQHFIVIIGKTDDNHYLAYDMWYPDEDAIFFDVRYGEPSRGILGMRLINGPVPQPPEVKPSIKDLEGQIAQWKQHFDDIKEHLRPAGIMPSDDLPTIIGALDGLVAIKKENETLKDQVKSLQEKPHEDSHPGYTFKDKWVVKKWLIEFWREVK